MKNQMGSSVLGKTLSVALILIILSSITALVYNIAAPPVTERFTEFYVLGENGKAEGYPENLTVGEEAKVIVAIINREHETASYSVEVRINQVRMNVLGPLALNQAEMWQETITFQPLVAGDKQKVEFLLFKSGQDEVYRSVYLLVKVR